jgi:diguanylate cyclase (GGDEF)-like protein
VANGLREHCSRNDYLARMGGDEFVLLIPDATTDEVEGRIEGIRSVIRSAGESTPQPCSLAVSVGIASCPDDGCDSETLLAEADHRMYKSKRQRKERKAPVFPLEPAPIRAAS